MKHDLPKSNKFRQAHEKADIILEITDSGTQLIKLSNNEDTINRLRGGKLNILVVNFLDGTPRWAVATGDKCKKEAQSG